MDLIIQLVIGGVIGWLASIVMKTNAQMGLFANIVVGIVGSFLGAFLANAAGIGPRGSVMTWVVSVIGAALLIALLRALGVFGRPASLRR